MPVDVSDLQDAVLNWANRAAGQALDGMRQITRERAPYGISEDDHAGPHILDTEEAIVVTEGETWEGELAYTAEHAGYQDLGSDGIVGNPWLYFHWQGHLIRVHQTRGYHVHDGWFSNAVTDESWAAELETAMDAETL